MVAGFEENDAKELVLPESASVGTCVTVSEAVAKFVQTL